MRPRVFLSSLLSFIAGAVLFGTFANNQAASITFHNVEPEDRAADREAIRAHIGSIFQAPNARGQMVSLTLTSVTPYKPSAVTKLATKSSPDTDSFSLMFKAAGPLPPFTSIHKVNHPSLGKFDLFLSPHSLEGKQRMYEAVFNHI